MNALKLSVMLLVGVTLVGTLAGCGAPPPGTIISDCKGGEVMQVVCGMQSPEDIAVVPNSAYLLLSELGSMGERSGRILRFNTTDDSWTPIYPGEQAAAVPATLQGDASCTTPPGPEMSPHGTHLVRLNDGSVRYLVVNHGGREAVELFNVSADANGAPTLQWRGCIVPAPNTNINDVVGLANGDAVYTRMFQPDSALSQWRSMLLKTQHGDVWRWNKNTGVRLLPGTQGSLTNGIEISADEQHVFINQYMDQEVHKYNLQNEKVVGVAQVANADNSAWGPSGELWLATHASDLPSIRACYGDWSKTCGMEFDIVALNPDTMATRSVFKHQGPPMGAATIATAHGDKVYIGSFLGDRLAIVPLAEFQ